MRTGLPVVTGGALVSVILDTGECYPGHPQVMQ